MKKKQAHILLTAIALLLLASAFVLPAQPAHAQNKKLQFNDLFKQDSRGRVYFKPDVARTLPYTHPDTFFMCYKEVFGLNDDHEIIKTNMVNNGGGDMAYFYQQYYKGILVEAEHPSFLKYKTNTIPNQIQLTADTSLHIENIEPSISPQQAMKISKNALPHSELYLFDLFMQRVDKKDTMELINRYIQLVWYKQYNKKYVLAYKCLVESRVPLQGFSVFVNASTGEVLEKRDEYSYLSGNSQ